MKRRIGLTDAVTIGLGSMIGAGVFSAWGPAAQAAGSGLLLGLAVAAVVALCNATSSAQLGGWLGESAWIYVESPIGAAFELPPNWRLHREGRAGAVGYALYRRIAADPLS